MAIQALNKNYVSTVNFLDQREILNRVLDITNERLSFVDVMEMMGRYKPTATTSYHNFTNTELYSTITIDGTPTVNDSNNWDQTITVSAADWAKVRVGEKIMTPGKQQGIIFSKPTSTTIRIKHVDTTTSLGIADTEVLAVFGNAHGEGSAGPEGRVYSVNKHFNQIQIFKEATQVTDIELGNKIEFEFNGQPYYFLKAQHDALMKFKGDISFDCFFSQISTTTFADSSPALADANGNAIQTMKGLDEYIGGSGINVTGATINLAQYASLTRQLNKRRCPDEYFIYMGTEHNIAHDDMLNALTSTAFSSNARIMVEGKELDLGVDTFNLYGRKYIKKHLPLLDHQNAINFTGSAGYEKKAYYVPNDKIKTQDGGQEDRLLCRYMEMQNGIDSKYREVLTGGLAPTPTSDTSILKITYESRQGIEVLGPDHFASIELS